MTIGDDQERPETLAQRCGFVALLGAPNAGKSTLMNALVGAKVSIVTPKVQTTRARIRGIAVTGESQIVFVDTPGIFEPKRRLERAMVAAAWSGADGADELVLLYDAQRKRRDSNTQRIIDGLRKRGFKACLVLNKIDLVKREQLLAMAAAFDGEGLFSAIFMISATKGDGVADLMAHLAEVMPTGPWLYPEDQLTDFPERLLAAEITREKLFLKLYQELPYSLTVETEAWQDFENGAVRMEQVIYVARDSQKAICLGKKGATIKEVRQAAQEEMEVLLGRKVHLFLFVKVRENWINDPERYRTWDLDFNA